jgi:hypothetical protein
MFGGEKRHVFSASNVLGCDPDLPDDPVLFVRTMLATNSSRSRVFSDQLRSWKVAPRAHRIRCRLAAVVR